MKSMKSIAKLPFHIIVSYYGYVMNEIKIETLQQSFKSLECRTRCKFYKMP